MRYSGTMLYESQRTWTLGPRINSIHLVQAYQTSSALLTISSVGVLGTIFLIRLLSSLVTRLGVTGMQGVKG